MQRYVTFYGLDMSDLVGVGFQWTREEFPLVYGCCDEWVRTSMQVAAQAWAHSTT